VDGVLPVQNHMKSEQAIAIELIKIKFSKSAEVKSVKLIAIRDEVAFTAEVEATSLTYS
jgi:hypothetical protein